MNTVFTSNGEILTGRLWRKSHSHFKNLPFYSNVPRMDDMVVPLEDAVALGNNGCYHTLLVVREFQNYYALESTCFR